MCTVMFWVSHSWWLQCGIAAAITVAVLTAVGHLDVTAWSAGVVVVTAVLRWATRADRAQQPPDAYQ